MAENRLMKTLPWLLGGVAVGAVVGVLYAPKAGKETRQDLADWLKKKRERTRELAHELREKIPAKRDQVVAAIRASKDAFHEAGHPHKETRETIGA